MAQLRQDIQKFIAQDTAIIVVSPEPAGALKLFWQTADLPFVGLPDPSHSVLKRYGQEVNLFKLGRMPAQVLVDKNGIARFVHYGHTMADIPENEEILALLQEMNSEAIAA